MFLILCLVVSAASYSAGAVVAELVFTSAEERRLPAALRAGLGMLLAIVYLAAAWQFVSIDQAWLLGIALLGAYAVGNRSALRGADAGRRSPWREHARGLGACMAGALLFFAPLIVAGNAGPFTEGSGDVSIYSDVSKLLTDERMTAFGQPSRVMENVIPNLRSLLDVGESDRFVRYAPQREAFIDAHRERLSLPSADYAAYRVVANVNFGSISFAPYAAFHLLSGTTNYPAYFGVQAIFYAILLCSGWALFRPFGRASAAMAVALFAASHGMVSVFYNGYSMQSICLAMCAIVLCLGTTVRPVSVPGLRSYGTVAAIALLFYTHYLSVLAPLIAMAVVAQYRFSVGRQPSEPRVHPMASHHGAALRIGVASVVGVLAAFTILGASGRTLEFISRLLGALVHETKNVYLGAPIAVLSWNWWAFLLGPVSQQHVQPFAEESRWLAMVLAAAVMAGASAATLGGALLLRLRGRDRVTYLSVYGALLLTIIVHGYVAQSSLYTQAKGAQDTLPIVYTVLMLPLAAGSRLHPDKLANLLTRCLWATLALLLVLLLATRFEYGYRLALLRDRATILETSYFTEAERVRRADPDFFVLFEPRKSADLYVSVQPFAGGRMIPTRHQTLERWDFARNTKEKVIASDLIGETDVPHLWTLSAEKRSDGSFEWKSRRVSTLQQPTLYLFGDDYERNSGKQARGADPGDTGTFSYLRNGAAKLYVPPGTGGDLELKLVALSRSEFETMLSEVKSWVRAGGTPDAPRLTDDGRILTLTYALRPRVAATMVSIARFSGEFRLNARLDGRELAAGDAPFSH